jgi:hypothetical protein
MALHPAFQEKCSLAFNYLIFAISIVIVPIHPSLSIFAILLAQTFQWTVRLFILCVSIHTASEQGKHFDY